MNVRTASRLWSRPSRGRRAAVAAAVVALGLAGLTACDSASGSDGPKLAADAAIPDKVPTGTVLRVGDPATQTAIEASGLDEELEGRGRGDRVGQHQWRPEDARRVPCRRDRRGVRAGHPPAVRAVDGDRRHHRGHHQPRGRDQPPRLRAGRRSGRRREVPGGPEGQEDRLLPRPGAGRAGAEGARQGGTDPGRRRARRDPERRRRLRQRPRQQAGRRGAARRHPADVVPREVRQRRRHLDPDRHP